MLSRRSFLATSALAALGARADAPAPAAPAPAARRLDPNLVVLVSDIHTGLPRAEQQYKTGRDYPHMPAAARRLVAEILALDPLPANVLNLGDISLAFGEEADYALAADVLKPLTDAGVTVTHTMGNHDIRASFLKHFPGYDQTTRVPGRFVSVVATPHADFVLLDSLKEPTVRGSYPAVTGFELGKPQTDWLKQHLAAATRPTFVCAHHTMRTLNLQKTLIKCPRVAGAFHGHHHSWQIDHLFCSYSDHARTLRSVGLPSFGLDRHIGYGILRLAPGAATLSCKMNDFYFPLPRTPRPPEWDTFVRDHRDREITFVL